jgi:predicted MFS family arabinose efflux permease
MSSTAILLGLCQFLFMAAVAVGIAFNGLVGEELAPSPGLATLPYLFITASAALLTLILPRIFAALGYQHSFALGAIFGFAGGLLSAWSVWQASFVMFCLAGLLIGVYQASALYYRFAAADAVGDDQKSSAIAWVLSGGILAALVGPMLGSYGLHLLATDYLGSFLLMGVLALLALPIIVFTRLPPRQTTQEIRPPLSLQSLLRYPHIRPAMFFCTGGYALMMLVMLATPLAMQHCGFGATDAASVIQWHLLGMFAPSLVTGKLITRFGSYPVALTGCLILALGCLLALTGEALMNFHWALLWVGVGWNFMYMGGSTLLTQVPDTYLRSRLQAVNEFVTYAAMTLTAGVTGWVYHQLGWQVLLMTAAALVLAILVLMLLQRWLGSQAITN